MKDIKPQQSEVLQESVMKIIAGESTPDLLLNHSSLSMTAMIKYLNEKFAKAGLPLLKGTLALARASHLYQDARKLKLFVQDIHQDTLENYQRVITEAQVLVQTGFNEEAVRMIKARVGAPHRALVAIAAGAKMPNPDYWVYTDRQLLDLCSGIESLSMMKHFYCTLHAHVKGRGLETTFLLENPDAIKNFYIDALDRRFFSYPEVVTANYLRLNKIEHIAQYDVPNLKEDEPARQADFYLPDINLLLEVSQNHDAGKGARKERYLKRLEQKKAQYQKAGYTAVFINTEHFFKPEGFDIEGYVRELQKVLKENGIRSSVDFAKSDLGYTNNKEKQLLVCLPKNELVQFLASQGIDGLATLKNNFHFYLEPLNLRSDFDAIMQHFRELGQRIRNEKASERADTRRETYASMQEVKQFFKLHGITSQKAWFAFAPRNKKLLQEARIPFGLPPVYSRLGTWEGWGALWADDLTAH